MLLDRTSRERVRSSDTLLFFAKPVMTKQSSGIRRGQARHIRSIEALIGWSKCLSFAPDLLKIY